MLGADYNINLSTSLFMIGKSPTPGSQGSALMYKHGPFAYTYMYTASARYIYIYVPFCLFVDVLFLFFGVCFFNSFLLLAYY